MMTRIKADEPPTLSIYFPITDTWTTLAESRNRRSEPRLVAAGMETDDGWGGERGAPLPPPKRARGVCLVWRLRVVRQVEIRTIGARAGILLMMMRGCVAGYTGVMTIADARSENGRAGALPAFLPLSCVHREAKAPHIPPPRRPQHHPVPPLHTGVCATVAVKLCQFFTLLFTLFFVFR